MSIKTSPNQAEVEDDSTPQADSLSQYQPDALAMAEHIGFDGDKLTINPQLVQSKIQRQKLSPSTTSALLDNCPASWAFGKLLPFDDSPFSPAGAGGLAHEVLENFYQRPPSQRTGVELAEEVSKVVQNTFGDNAAKTALLTQKLNHLAGGIFDLEDPAEIDVDRVEQTIQATIAGVPTTGTVDRTEITQDGDTWISDYKSGKYSYPEKYHRAMRIYALLKEADTGQLPVGLSLLYTAAGEEVDVPMTDRQLDAAEQDLVDAWDLHNTCVDQAAFPTKASPLCGWCPLANLCPTAKKAKWQPSKKAVDAGIEFLPAPDDSQATSHPDTTIDDISIATDTAGHCPTNQQDTGTETEPNDSSQQDDLMAKTTKKPTPIEQRPPFEMLTNNGELNPNSWAANTLFQLYAQVDAAVRRLADGIDRDEQQQLTADVFSDVSQTIADAVAQWTNTNVTPQDGAFTRLSHVASTYLRHTAVDLDSRDDIDDWLDALYDELGLAIGAVLDSFDDLMPYDD